MCPVVPQSWCERKGGLKFFQYELKNQDGFRHPCSSLIRADAYLWWRGGWTKLNTTIDNEKTNTFPDRHTIFCLKASYDLTKSRSETSRFEVFTCRCDGRGNRALSADA